MFAPRPIPLGALALLLSGCLDFGFKPVVDDDRDTSVPDGDAGVPPCPSKAEACADHCGRVELPDCEPYECEACPPPECSPIVTCESIQAQCGSVDTGCGMVECSKHCEDGVSCLDNQCCTAEPVAVTCRGLCGGSAFNNCGDQVACEDPCGQHSSGCQGAEPPQAATCFCPHAYQGETCEEKQLPLVRPVDLAVDPGSGRTYVLDAGLRALLVVDLDTGARWTLSDADDDGVARGTGSAFEVPQRMAVDVPHRRAYIVDLKLGAVMEVNLDTGRRSYLSGQDEGSGPELKSPKGIVLDVPNDVAYVIDDDALFTVRLSTGERRIVSTGAAGSEVGAGPPLRIPQDLAVDLAGGRAYVFGSNALFAVELASGDRTLLSTGTASATPSGTLRGAGPKFMTVFSGALDLANHRAFAGDIQLDYVFAIDLDSGDRTILSAVADADGVPHGTGPEFVLPQGLRLDASGTGLWLVDAQLGTIGHVDIASGNRSPRVDGGVGAGPRLYEAMGFARYPDGSQALVADRDKRCVVTVNLASGQRTVLAGEGQELELPYDVAIDRVGRYAYVADMEHGIVRIDLQTGLRTLLSDEHDTSLGPLIGSGSTIALDEPGQRLLATRWGELLAINLATGRRTVLFDSPGGGVVLDPTNRTVLVLDSDPFTLFRLSLVDGTYTVLSGELPDGSVRGAGDELQQVVDIVLDAEAQRAYVLERQTQGVFSVDLVTGDRAIVSSAEGGRKRSGNGIAFQSTEQLTLGGAGRLLVSDSILGALISVDIATGDRSLVSRVTF